MLNANVLGRFITVTAKPCAAKVRAGGVTSVTYRIDNRSPVDLVGALLEVGTSTGLSAVTVTKAPGKRALKAGAHSWVNASSLAVNLAAGHSTMIKVKITADACLAKGTYWAFSSFTLAGGMALGSPNTPVRVRVRAGGMAGGEGIEALCGSDRCSIKHGRSRYSIFPLHILDSQIKVAESLKSKKLCSASN